MPFTRSLCYRNTNSTRLFGSEATLQGSLREAGSAPADPASCAEIQSSPRYALRTCAFSLSSFAGPSRRDPAGLEHVAAARRVERHQRVLLDEQDRRPLLVDLPHDLEDPLDEDRRQPHRGLVEQQQLRPRHQRAADRAHLLLAAGHRPRLLLLPLGQAREELEDAVDVLLEVRLVGALERAHLEVLEHGHAREEAPPLRRLRDSHLHDRVRGRVGDVLAAEADRALARMVEAVDRAQRRRLAGAVRADQRDDLALVHLERDALQRLDRAVVGVDVLELQDDGVPGSRLSHRASPPCRGRPRSRGRPSGPPAGCPRRSSRRSRAR